MNNKKSPNKFKIFIEILKDKMQNWLTNLLIFIIGVLPIGCIIFEICVFATYGNKSVDEVPLWALWFLFRG